MYLNPFFQSFEHKSTKRWQTRFAICLSSITTFDSTKQDDRNDFVGNMLDRQVDLISALTCAQHEHSVELRYISQPCADEPLRGDVTVALLVQVAGDHQDTSLTLAAEFCENLMTLLKSLFEEYEWLLVKSREAFLRIDNPFDFRYIGEILRREDQIFLDTVRQTPRHKPMGFARQQEETSGRGNSVYYVLPFIPNRNAMDGVCRILLHQPAPAMLSICLRPTILTPEEEQAFEQVIERCEQYLTHGTEQVFKDLTGFHPTLRLQAEAVRGGCLKQMLQLEDNAFLLKIQLTSPEPIPHGLLDAIGVNITEHAGARTDIGSSQEGAFQEYFSGGFESLLPSAELEIKSAIENLNEMAFQPWWPSKAPEQLQRLRYLFDTHQACAAFRLPIPQEDDFAGIETQRYRSLPIPREIPAEGLHLGVNRCHGVDQPIRLLRDDRRRHMYVVGQTGTGKSNFFLNMIMQDIKAGEGVGVIDPHGELIEAILPRIPSARMKDVILIDPSDSERSVGINLLEFDNGVERDVAVNQMLEIFDKLYDLDKTGGPMFEQYMRNTLYLVTEDPESGSTLVEVPRILTNRSYRKYKLSHCQNEYVKRYWVEEAERAGGESSLANIAPYITSKLTRFLYNDLLRPMLAQSKSAFNMREVMDHGKILLVNLCKGKLGETNSAFLGMLVIGKILAKALSRGDIQARSHLKDFYLYVDEFQSVATDTFITILSEARKYRLNLIITNQYIHQIDDRIQNAIFGNVGTIASFRVGLLDAERLEKEFSPLVSQLDLMNLPNFNGYVTTIINGESTKPFSMRTVLDTTPVDESLGLLIVEQSRMAYTRSAKEVEQEIQDRWDLVVERQKAEAAAAQAASSEQKPTGAPQ